MERVLITGGAGFIGAYVCTALAASGKTVVAYDAQPVGNVLDAIAHEVGEDRLVTVQGEICDALSLMRTCQEHGITHIVHLASPLTKAVDENPIAGVRDICIGTQTVLETAAMSSVRRVVWTSSVAVFGRASEYPSAGPANDAPTTALSLYGRAKALTESLARFAWTRDGVESVGLRLSLVYGAGRVRGYMSGPSLWLQDIAQGRVSNVQFADQPYHWQYVEEVAQMIIESLFSPTPGEGLTFNTWGETATRRQLAEMVSLTHPHVRHVFTPGLDPSLQEAPTGFDATAFLERYDYRPTWPLSVGLAETIRGYERMAAASHKEGVSR